MKKKEILNEPKNNQTANDKGGISSSLFCANNKSREIMKTIVVRWVKEEDFGYGKALLVIESQHERFLKGSRFDYGFFNVASDEGYTIISLPMNTNT